MRSAACAALFATAALATRTAAVAAVTSTAASATAVATTVATAIIATLCSRTVASPDAIVVGIRGLWRDRCSRNGASLLHPPGS